MAKALFMDLIIGPISMLYESKLGLLSLFILWILNFLSITTAGDILIVLGIVLALKFLSLLIFQAIPAMAQSVCNDSDFIIANAVSPAFGLKMLSHQIERERKKNFNKVSKITSWKLTLFVVVVIATSLFITLSS